MLTQSAIRRCRSRSKPGGPSPLTNRRSSSRCSMHTSRYSRAPTRNSCCGSADPGIAGAANGAPGSVGLLVVQFLEQREIQVGLAGEMVVEAAHAGARPVHDAGHAGLGVALGREHMPGRREQRGPGRGARARTSSGSAVPALSAVPGLLSCGFAAPLHDLAGQASRLRRTARCIRFHHDNGKASQ